MGRFERLNPRRLVRRLGPRKRKVLEITVGVMLLVIGAISGFIPLVQGWVFGLAGLALLSRHSKRVRAFYEPLKERLKKAGRGVRERVERRRRPPKGSDP